MEYNNGFDNNFRFPPKKGNNSKMPAAGTDNPGFGTSGWGTSGSGNSSSSTPSIGYGGFATSGYSCPGISTRDCRGITPACINGELYINGEKVKGAKVTAKDKVEIVSNDLRINGKFINHFKPKKKRFN